MPSRLRSPKTLSEWVELDGHRRPRLFAGSAAWLWGGAILGAALLVGVLAASGKRAFQAGPVSHPHALFGHDCGKCHEKALTTVTRLWAGDGVGTVTDRACVECHAGPPHHGAVGRCADCHKEHRGHDALVRVGDAKCVGCHADLSSHGKQRASIPDVTAFTAIGHPPFPAFEKHERRLKFNHAAHLNKDGIAALKGLECAGCHQTDEAGRYMKPISYEAHCIKCHGLGVKPAGAFPGDTLPHPRKGEGPAKVRAAARDALTRFILDPRHKGLLDPAEAPRPLPDRDPPEGQAMSRAGFEWVNKQMGRIEWAVLNGGGGCRLCHESGKEVNGLPEVAPPTIPDRWRERARFRHDAHRMLNCAECHPAETSSRASEVLLPAMDTCLKCHDARDRTKARSGCMDCHSYHDEKVRREGRGKGKLTIPQAGGR